MANEATIIDLNLQMFQDPDVLNGWDAVMNLLESSVNEFFQSQWQTQTSGSGGKMVITGLWCDGNAPAPPPATGNVTTVVQYDVQLDAPLFQFENDQANVTVTQKIIGGTMKMGSMKVPKSFQPGSCGCKVNDPNVAWAKPVNIDLSAKPTVSGTVSLQQVKGLVKSSAHSVVLDFAQGSFQVNNMTIKGVNNEQFASQIKNWFHANDIKYILASVDFKNLSSLAALTPTSFQFYVMTTNAGNTIVQLLITTNGTPAKGKPIVEEPIPTVDGMTCSLMISSRILYQDIFVGSFNSDSGEMAVEAVAPTSDDQAWYARVTSGSVSTPKLIPGNQPYQTDDGLMAVTLDANTWSLVGSEFVPFKTLGGLVFAIQLKNKVNTIQKITANMSVTKFRTYGPFPVPLDVKLTYGFNFFVGDSRDELKIIPNGDGNVRAGVTDPSGKLAPAAVGSSTESINESLGGSLASRLDACVGAVSFKPVSIFALQNLIFPGKNLINTSQVPFASTPNDLLIVGTMGT